MNNNLVKLAIAIMLGGAAAVTNMAWLAEQKNPPLYTGAKANVPPGTVLTDAHFTPVPIPGDPTYVKKSFIPYRERSVLLGSRSPRSYRTGDLFIYSDLRLPAKKSNWEILGPFRIVGVGGAFKEKSLNETRVGGGGNNVTIAISPELDARTQRLLEVLASRSITAVQVIPADEIQLTKQALKETEKENYVHQTISLAGIENIPTVLYNGEVIQFIVRIRSKY